MQKEVNAAIDQAVNHMVDVVRQSTLTIYQICEVGGFTDARLYDILNFREKPSLHEILRFALGMNIPPHRFFAKRRIALHSATGTASQDDVRPIDVPAYMADTVSEVIAALTVTPKQRLRHGKAIDAMVANMDLGELEGFREDVALLARKRAEQRAVLIKEKVVDALLAV